MRLEEPYPQGWDDLDDYSAAQQMGENWLEAEAVLCLDVPSVAGAPIERNVVIDAHHPRFGEVEAVETIDPLYDPRVWI